MKEDQVLKSIPNSWIECLVISEQAQVTSQVVTFLPAQGVNMIYVNKNHQLLGTTRSFGDAQDFVKYNRYEYLKN